MLDVALLGHLCMSHDLRAHNPKAAGSNPAPFYSTKAPHLRGFRLLGTQTKRFKMARGRRLGQHEAERSIPEEGQLPMHDKVYGRGR
jgi:hypothetical protein